MYYIELNVIYEVLKTVFNHQVNGELNLFNANHLAPFMTAFMSYKKLGKGANAGRYYTNSARVENNKGRGVDDYFTQAEGHEPPGTWFDPSGSIQGITHGQMVNKSVFENLLAGCSPIGKKLTQTIDDAHVAGFDVVFSVPKGVSAIWAVANDVQREMIEHALQRANVSAMKFLASHAGISRRGKGGVIDEKVHLIAATWPHSCNRNGDPQRHYHNVVFNVCKHSDGTYGALESEHLMRWQMATGAYFRAAVAYCLHQEFPGMEFNKTYNGSFDIQGVPQELLNLWSFRRNEINEVLEEGGLQGTVRQRNRAWADTRVNKTFDETPAQMHDRWLIEAESYRFSLSAALKEGQKLDVIDDGKWGAAGFELTRTKSIFTEQELYRFIAEQSVGISPATIESRIEKVKMEMIGLGMDVLDRTIFTTVNMVQTEMSLQAYAKKLSADGQHGIEQSVLNATISMKGISSSLQADAIRHACSSGSIKVVEGLAAGKPTLNALRDVFESQGYGIQGLASSLSSAHLLQESVNLRSSTIANYLQDVEQKTVQLNNMVVVIIHENELVSSNHTNQLLRLAYEYGAKIIILEDDLQVSVGAAMKLIKESASNVCVDEIFIQKDEWQRQMVTNFSADRADVAIDVLNSHGLVQLHDDRSAMLKAMADDYFDYIKHHPDKSALLLTGSNADMIELNLAIRALKRKDGLFNQDDVVIKTSFGELPFAARDKIMFRKNEKSLDVINRAIGTVESIKDNGNGFLLTVDIDGHKVEVNTDNYRDAKGALPIQHAYSMTINSSQSIGVNKTFVMHSNSISRRHAHMAFSRHIDETQLYIDVDGQRKYMMNKLKRLSRKGFMPTNIDVLDSIKRQYCRQSDKTSTVDYWDRVAPKLRDSIQASVDDLLTIKTTMAIHTKNVSVSTKAIEQIHSRQTTSNVVLADAMKQFKEAVKKVDSLDRKLPLSTI
jgi:conjugative relaxase-like TrwC/TraI family protein